MAVAFGVLGPLQVVRDGVTLSVGGGKDRTLLADLLIHANRVVHAERLIYDVWGETARETAPNTLQVHIAGLRKLLGPDGPRAILTRRPGYLAAVAEESLDSLRFEALARSGRARMKTKASEAVFLLEDALTLWRGPPLEDVVVQDFAIAEVARLEELHAAVVEDLAEVKMALGRDDEVVPDLRQIIEDHPMRERPRQQLMLALYRTGRQAEALESYRAFREHMVDELGIEPSVPLREMESAILNQDVRLASPAVLTSPDTSVSGAAVDEVEPTAVRDERPEASDDEPLHERKHVTVLWCGFFAPPPDASLDVEEQTLRFDRYMDEVADVVTSHGGTIEMIAGDTLMAVFGAPQSHADDPERAVRAGLRILTATQRSTPASTSPAAQARVGIATGEALVGVGAAPPRNSRVSGDVVVTAFRVCQASKVGTITVAEHTFEATNRLFEYESVAPPDALADATAGRLWRVSRERATRDGAVTEVGARRSVGREYERALLASALARSMRANVVQLVTIVGDAGVGKTRLVADLALHTATLASPVTVLHGHCHAYGDNVSLSPLRDIVKAYSGILETDSPAARTAKLARAIPDDHPDARWLRQRLKPLAGIDIATANPQESLTAWRKFLELIAESAPAVLVFEDLHWADDLLLELLEHAVDFAEGVPMLLIGTTRQDLYDRAPHWASMTRNTTRIDLESLTEGEMRQLIADSIGQGDLPTDLESAILSRACGNPLYASEFLHLLRDRRLLVHKRAGWQLKRGEEIPVPATVRDTISARLDALSKPRKRLLQDAAVMGELFWPGAAAAIGRRDQHTVDVLLQDLSRSGLVRRLRRSSMNGEEEYTFHHALVREVCYSELPRQARAVRHQRAAAWLEAMSAAEGLIGHHLAEACRYHADLRLSGRETAELALRGAGYLLADCEQALRYGDRTTAARNTDRILEILTNCSPDVCLRRPQLLVKTAKLLVTMGRWRDAVSMLSPYADSGQTPLVRDLGVALCQLHRDKPRSSGFIRGQRLLEDAATSVPPDIDALASLGGSWRGLDDAKARQAYRRCLDMDPANAYALGNTLEYEISDRGEAAVFPRRQHVLAARERCLSQALAGENLPWAWFDAGKFSLLLHQPDEGLFAYAKAVQLTTADHMLTTAISSLDRLIPHMRSSKRLTRTRYLLSLARGAHFPSSDATAAITNARPIPHISDSPCIVVLAAGTDATADRWLASHAGVLMDGFRDFHGTVISGGTRSGVISVIGDIKARDARHVVAIGYVPARMSSGAQVDARYDEVRVSVGHDFSITESLQAWADLLASGIRPSCVKVLAVNGGPIAAAEYRIALALGAVVGVVRESGREADILLRDPEWCRSPNLVPLVADAAAVHRFLAGASTEGPTR